MFSRAGFKSVHPVRPIRKPTNLGTPHSHNILQDNRKIFVKQRKLREKKARAPHGWTEVATVDNAGVD